MQPIDFGQARELIERGHEDARVYLEGAEAGRVSFSMGVARMRPHEHSAAGLAP